MNKFHFAGFSKSNSPSCMTNLQCANCGKPVQEHFVFVEADDDLDVSCSHLSSSQLTSSVLSSSTLSNASSNTTGTVASPQPPKQSHTLPPTQFHKNLNIHSDIKFQLEACMVALNNQDIDRLIQDTSSPPHSYLALF